MDILIPTGVQKGHISGKKSPHNLLKNVLSKLYFQPEGDWYGNFLFYILFTVNAFFFTSYLVVYLRRFSL